MSGSGSEPETTDRDSSFSLSISLTIGYNRKRAILGGAFEGHVVTLGLLIGGLTVAVLVVLGLVHVLGVLPF